MSERSVFFDLFLMERTDFAVASSSKHCAKMHRCREIWMPAPCKPSKYKHLDTMGIIRRYYPVWKGCKTFLKHEIKFIINKFLYIEPG